MKAEFDKEIDSLLRRESARRGRATPAAPATSHLDADEQNAYAENALPAASRAHYAAHLADCDDCRRSVTQLALAAGMPAQLEQPRETAGQAVSTQVGWRERLGALFAPRALRYVAPAMALLLVGAISLIVLTRKPAREEVSVAQHNTAETERTQPPQPEAHHAPQNDNAATTAATPAAESAPASPDLNASQSREEVAANNPRGVLEQPLVTAPLNDSVPPAPASGSGASAPSVSEMAKPAPTPAPVSDALTITSEQQEAKVKSGERTADLRKLEQRPGVFENRQYENRQREQISGPYRSNNEQARNARVGNADNSQDRADKKDENPGAPTAPPSAATTTATARRSTRREADRAEAEKRVAEDSERSAAGRKLPAETRTVAGRKFRRQGDAWVDTAYNAGQSYTVVRRNSEQFRALVADEPQLRHIAGALDGDVTVVWKGRAYRFR
ncbi:MAG TPA: zf-HC2 domain-containing protein [Pyrinomonadaceae bacterium]|jgi:hypothetical protein|nr:zf-HC2 domain-containing protein [Pyrinomonadaceae bacterium]